jgi:hypothetical protein
MKTRDRAYRDAFGETAKLTIVGYHNGHEAISYSADAVRSGGTAKD